MPVRARSRLVPIAVALIAASGCAASPGSNRWPVRPVRVIVPFGAGTGLDLAARLYAPLLAERWQQPVVVDNRPGGDGTAGVLIMLSCHRRSRERWGRAGTRTPSGRWDFRAIRFSWSRATSRRYPTRERVTSIDVPSQRKRSELLGQQHAMNC